jgi:hypothetical protein
VAKATKPAIPTTPAVSIRRPAAFAQEAFSSPLIHSKNAESHTTVCAARRFVAVTMQPEKSG